LVKISVTTTALRQDVYSAIRTLLVANKPTYDYGSETFTYSIVAEYGRQNASFPYIVLNPASVNVELLCLDGSAPDYMIEVQLDFYAKEQHRRVAIDAGADSVMDTIIDNQASLKSTDGLLLMQDPFDESNTTQFDDSQQVLNTKSLVIKVKVQ